MATKYETIQHPIAYRRGRLDKLSPYDRPRRWANTFAQSNSEVWIEKYCSICGERMYQRWFCS
jgi:hypothetical protein